MLRRTLPQSALLRSTVILRAGMKDYHEWQMHEPLLQNYEGWRILDNPKMTRLETYTYDFAGIGRHIDPIIDDPRLTHRQRVCRLYRWALKEFNNYLACNSSFKFNIGYKVVRMKFEKYRYVTDPGMCDMMVRESQKYLREVCSNAFHRRDPRSSHNVQTFTFPLFHPDNALVYDHWTPYEVQLYEDAKLHRYSSHMPNMAYLPEFHERFGDPWEARRFARNWLLMAFIIWGVGMNVWMMGFFWQSGWNDDFHFISQKHFHQETLQAMEAFERNQRSRYSQSSIIANDWDIVLGKVYQKAGYWNTGGRFADQTVIPRNAQEHQTNI